MAINRVGLAVVALALSACGSGAMLPSPSTPAPSPPNATQARPPAVATVAPASPVPTVSPPQSEPPSASGVLLGSVQIPFADRAMAVTIVGEPGIVVAWRAATERELEAIAWPSDADIVLRPMSGRELILGWIGTVCDVKATLTVAPRRLVVTPAPRQGCDAVGVGRGVVLTYAELPDLNTPTVELGERVLLPESS